MKRIISDSLLIIVGVTVVASLIDKRAKKEINKMAEVNKGCTTCIDRQKRKDSVPCKNCIRNENYKDNYKMDSVLHKFIDSINKK